MPTESELASSYRAAETRLLAEYGLTATERMVPVPGEDVVLHVLDIPGDPSRPPVVLLHGAASVTAAAIPLIPAFDGRRVIAPDWPGHGLSSAATFEPDELRTRAVGWLDAVVAAYGLDTFELVGHSLGGQFALYYALAHPEKVDHLILLGAPGAGFAEMRAPFAFRVISLPWIGRGAFSREVSREQYGANSALTLGPGTVDAWPPELVDVGYFASKREAFKDDPSLSITRRSPASGARRKSSVVSHAELAKLSMPVLILWGDTDVFLVPERGVAVGARDPGRRGGRAPRRPRALAEPAGGIGRRHPRIPGWTTQDLRCQPLVEISCRCSTGFVSIPPSLPETGPVDGDPLWRTRTRSSHQANPLSPSRMTGRQLRRTTMTTATKPRPSSAPDEMPDPDNLRIDVTTWSGSIRVPKP